jgi:hypothetical protein
LPDTSLPSYSGISRLVRFETRWHRALDRGWNNSDSVAPNWLTKGKKSESDSGTLQKTKRCNYISPDRSPVESDNHPDYPLVYLLYASQSVDRTCTMSPNLPIY